MQYKILSTDGNSASLSAEVNRHIEDGWIPQGGVCIATGYSYQAMIKN